MHEVQAILVDWQTEVTRAVVDVLPASLASRWGYEVFVSTTESEPTKKDRERIGPACLFRQVNVAGNRFGVLFTIFDASQDLAAYLKSQSFAARNQGRQSGRPGTYDTPLSSFERDTAGVQGADLVPPVAEARSTMLAASQAVYDYLAKAGLRCEPLIGDRPAFG